MVRHVVRAALLATLAVGGAFTCQAQMVPNLSAGACGPLTNAFGPWDYRPDHFKAPEGDPYSYQYKLHLVNMAHFTPSVEALIKGNSSSIGGDLDYTLRAFPNHVRALLSMMRYGERLKVPQVPGAQYSVECYFVRALTFAPDDTIVRLLFATYLRDQNRMADALKQLAAARGEAGDDAALHYNIGRLYLEMHEPALAEEEARRALELGDPRTDLKAQLIAAGHWSAAPAAASAAAASQAGDERR